MPELDTPLPVTLITLGTLFLIGLASDLLARRLHLPRVSILLLAGFLIGPGGLGLLPELDPNLVSGITLMALAMVGFLLGEQLTLGNLRLHGRQVMVISICVTLLTSLVVTGGLWLLGFDPALAILLGSIAAATDPAATLDVVREARARGPFSRVLLGVVAVDDVWGLLMFSIALSAAQLMSGNGQDLTPMLHGLRELFGALGLGAALGVPMAYLSGRLRSGEPSLAEALGFVFLCAGLAVWLDLSFLLASMVLGLTVASLARHHDFPFHAIEGIEWPFLILFFVLAGATLDPAALGAVGTLGAAYILLRVLGRLVGGWSGASLAGSPRATRPLFGAALLPQAGVAIGMALLGAQRLPEHADTLMVLVIASTVIFEVSGPILTRFALHRSGEVSIQVNDSEDDEEGKRPE